MICNHIIMLQINLHTCYYYYYSMLNDKLTYLQACQCFHSTPGKHKEPPEHVLFPRTNEDMVINICLINIHACLFCTILLSKNWTDYYHSNLRMDSLAQILTYANVKAGGRYIVVDNCSGLVLGSMIERMNGE